MKTALVVPTIREKSIQDFLRAWNIVGEEWDEIIVVEDNPTRTFKIDVSSHVSWKEISEDLGEHAWIISKRDSAIRSYGLLLAYRLGADYIFTLDDDCQPVEKGFVKQHLNNLNNTSKWCESVPGQRTRGLPYKNLGKAENVMLSVGLWTGTPDYDAVQMLSGQNPKLALPETRVMPIGQYFPLCGMNFAFKRQVTPLCYFPLMGDGYKFRRFDDIWFGIICKKICDHLGYMITCGKPYIYHSKASDPFANLEKEAPGIKMNEHFWEIIDDIPLHGSDMLDCIRQIAVALSGNKDEYLSKLGRALDVWASLFKA